MRLHKSRAEVISVTVNGIFSMSIKTKRFLVYSFLVVALLFLVFHGLAMAKPVLAPVFLAIILAMMLTPVANWLEARGLNRGWAAFFSDLIFLLFILGVVWAVGYEIQNLSKNWTEIHERLVSLLDKGVSFLEKSSGISIENPLSQTSGAAGESTSLGGGPSPAQPAGDGPQPQNDGSDVTDQMPVQSWLTSIASSLFSSLTTFLLVVVYIFFMLMYRRKFEKAVLKFIPNREDERGKKVLSEIVEDAKQYLIGRVILIGLLTVVYSIGFYFSGMQSPFTSAFIASFLTLIPYVGNIVGGLIAVGVAFATSGKLSAVGIVLGTMVVAQFIESYIIQPYLVGAKVRVNPLFTILAVTIGSAVWGIIGMIVFLPLFSFIKAVADHVSILEPLAYTIGKEGDDKHDDPA